MTITDGKEVYTRHSFVTVTVLSNRMELPLLQPYIHEEVDTCLTVPALDASFSGHKQIKIRSNDTDVVLLVISVVN